MHGGFGAFSFSASSSYKKNLSEVSSGEKVCIIPSAKCSYYFSNIDLTLHPGFYGCAKALKRNSSKANLHGINYNFLREKLVGIEKLYCQQFLYDGLVNTCEESVPIGITIRNYDLHDSMETLTSSETSCISICFENRHCLSIGYITDSNKCELYGNAIGPITAATPFHFLSKKNINAKILIFPERVNERNTFFRVVNLRVTANLARPNNSTVNFAQCKKACLQDVSCDVVSFCSDQNYYKSETSNCRMYSSKTLLTLEIADSKKKIMTYFTGWD